MINLAHLEQDEKRKKNTEQKYTQSKKKKGGAVMWLRYSKPSIAKNVLEAFR